MPKFRWVTKVLVGQWRPTRNAAMSDALGRGHAFINSGKGHIIMLRPFTTIERSKS